MHCIFCNMPIDVDSDDWIADDNCEVACKDCSIAELQAQEEENNQMDNSITCYERDEIKCFEPDCMAHGCRLKQQRGEAMSDDIKERLQAGTTDFEEFKRMRLDALARIEALEAQLAEEKAKHQLTFDSGRLSFNDKCRENEAIKAQLAAAREALDNSQSLIVMVHHIGTELNHESISSLDWETEGLSKLLTEQITENRASLGKATQ